MSDGFDPTRIRALLLDMGGVLIDTMNAAGLPDGQHDHRGRQALLHHLRDHGVRSTLDDLDRLLFRPWRAEYAHRYERGREAPWEPHLERLRTATGIESDDLTLLGIWFRPYAEHLFSIPGAAEALDVLSERGFPLALVSNVPLPGALYEEVLVRHDLRAPFAHVFFSYDQGSRKPSPQMLRRALAALGVDDPAEAVMVGDRKESDVAAGRSAGTATVWIASSHDQGPDPDVQIPDLASLPAVLEPRTSVPSSSRSGRPSSAEPSAATVITRPRTNAMKAPKDPPVALGVAGGTGSGKTTVARKILDTLGRDRIAFLAQDSYYRDIEWQSPKELEDHNFDHPRAIDHDLLVDHLRALKAGEAVEVPVYDFVTHRRTEDTRRAEPRQVILLEGILIFAEPRLRQLLDFKIYVDTDADVRFIRRLRRDIRERGRTLDDVVRQYLGTVRPMHLEFVEPSKRWADVIVPEGGENRVAMEMVTARVGELLG